jgi:peptide/nickel transport system permease protein
VTAFKPVLLWTDALVWVLIAAAAVLIVHILRQPHLRVPWKRVARDPVAMAAGVVLVFFLAIAFFDTLHFRPALEAGPNRETQYSGEVLSLLDSLLERPRSQVEKTYSAPFATRQYVKESVSLADGGTVRTYPRLLYGGAHLTDEAGKGADIAKIASLGALAGLLAFGAMAGLAVVMVSRHRKISATTAVRQIIHGEAELAWRSALITLAAMLIVCGILASLSGYYHVLGTDKVGQDVFYLTVKSIRTGVLIGTLTTLAMLPLAMALGVAAGYFGGIIDDVIQYIYTVLNSIPGVLLIAAAVLILQVHIETHAELFDTTAARADARLLALCLILGITSWTGLCRLLRGETLKVREMDYVQAAQAFGVGNLRILGRHILPNVFHLVLITVIIDFSGLVLAEAVLSYVGVGVDPTMSSWGNMINGARLEMAREPVVWWPLASAFLFMFTLVLAANLFADSVRDAFDPRTARR